MLRYGLVSLFFLACTGKTVAQSSEPTEPSVGPNCQDYLKAVEENEPDRLEQAEELFGAKSTCWRGDGANCEAVCKSAALNVRSLTCAANETKGGCMTCCANLNPEGTERFEESLSKLDSVANVSCGPDPEKDFEDQVLCRESKSLTCRQCAAKIDVRPMGDCERRESCRLLTDCFRGCKVDSLTFGL